jgi:2-polyprenyl-6-methoxyphenol hydroxylase-like FAD-dependent oxidoreductase
MYDSRLDIPGLGSRESEMAEVVMVGGGVVGLCGGLLLARDGHRVTLLERDPAPATPPEDAWTGWERRGVNQFRMLHYFLPRFREVLEAELPDVAGALDGAGALRTNVIASLPTPVSGGARPGDERFTALTGRRPVVESAISRRAEREPGLEIRRGAAVRALVTGVEPRWPGVPRVVGVVTDAGEELAADLVVDVSGRRSSLPQWLAAIGARPPEEEREDSGFVYYGRHFRSHDGSVPPAFGPPLQPYDSVSLLMLPADNGTWGVGLITSAGDGVLRAARHADVWERIVRSYPLAAHWLDGETISDGVEVMAKLEDRHRRLWAAGTPVATGIVALGDAWACTNPSVGRGASIGLLHALCLRELLRQVPADDRVDLVKRWDELTTEVVEPWYRETVAFDRHRLAEIDAQIEGVRYETDDPAWLHGEALRRSGTSDPDLLRAGVAIRSLLERSADVLARPGLVEKAMSLIPPEPPPGPSRAELVALVERESVVGAS